MRNRVLLAGLAWVGVSAGLSAQEPPAATAPAKSAVELFREAQALIRDGRFDVAAERLKAFLAANPTDADILTLARPDPAAFQKLRNVVVWSDDPAANAEAVKARDAVITRAETATLAANRDDKRIRQLVQNLGNVREERVFALQELGKLGTAPVPALADEIKATTDADLRAGLFEAVRGLPAETVPGFLAAAEGLPPDARLGILRAVVSRADVLSLAQSAESDFTPHLWHAAADADAGLKAFGLAQLDRLSGGRAGRLKADDELVKLAEPFVSHTARFRGGERPTLWAWDAAAGKLTSVPATKAEAEEFFAVRNLRWSLAANPNSQPAQELFLAVTTERAVERAAGRDLAGSDPALYRILAAAPATTLVPLLDAALADKRTSLAVGLTEVLASRGDRTAAHSDDTNRPAVLVRALDYPDFRVQFAAAQGLLRAPGAATHGRQARIVEILRKAAAAQGEAAGEKTVGRALVADPVDARGEKTARYLRAMGYAVERLATGKQLIRRANQAADYDLIVLDRHVAAPVVADTLAQLRSDAVAGTRPVLLVASADRVVPVGLEQLLARLAALAILLPDDADRASPVTVEPPFTFDPRRPVTDEAKERADNRTRRDTALLTVFQRRLNKLERLVQAADLSADRDLKARLADRLPQLVLTGLQAKYGVSPNTAPRTFDRLRYYSDLVARRAVSAAALDGVPTGGLARLVETLEGSLADRREFDGVTGRLLATLPGSGPTAGDAQAEAQLTRLAKLYPAVTVIPEPFALGEAPADGVGFGLKQDVATATRQPADKPATPDARKRMAVQAVRWLRALAVGENLGFDITPAEAALRQALRDDDLAPDAIDAVSKIKSAEAQQDLLTLALSQGRPLPLRVRAARHTVRHLQHYGRFIPPAQASDIGRQASVEADPELRSYLLVIEQLAAGKPGDLGRLMSEFPPPLPKSPVPAAPDAAEKKPEDKPVEKKD